MHVLQLLAQRRRRSVWTDFIDMMRLLLCQTATGRTEFRTASVVPPSCRTPGQVSELRVCVRTCRTSYSLARWRRRTARDTLDEQIGAHLLAQLCAFLMRIYSIILIITVMVRIAGRRRQSSVTATHSAKHQVYGDVVRCTYTTRKRRV